MVFGIGSLGHYLDRRRVERYIRKSNEGVVADNYAYASRALEIAEGTGDSELIEMATGAVQGVSLDE